jgi:hypothetical protein
VHELEPTECVIIGGCTQHENVKLTVPAELYCLFVAYLTMLFRGLRKTTKLSAGIAGLWAEIEPLTSWI